MPRVSSKSEATPRTSGPSGRTPDPPPRTEVASAGVPLTSFVGREREIAEVTELLGRARLVSLTGAGGTGKTRLAREVMAAARGEFPDGVAWVDLSGLADPGLLWQRVAGAVGIRAQGGRDHRHALAQGLATRRLLLVLDSCEHLVDGVAELAHELLTTCEGLRVLLTSREALGIPGEHAWHVPPLSLPDEGARSPEQLLGSEAGRLFVERARAARSVFQLTEETVPAVVRICRRLDGIPLALELAAARIRVLAPSQISERLDDTFRLLTEGGRTTIPRHRTLRAAIDWSYDLLSEDEALFLLRLSVFRGSFSLSAAEEVCAEPGADGAPDPYRVLDLIERLVERSLVEVQEARGSVVYRLLETVRQYAEGRLEEAGEADALRERHARFFMGRVLEAEPFLTGVHRREWVDRLGRDLDNLRQVLAWSRDHDPEMYLEVSGALCWFWFSSRYWAEGRRWLEGALRLSGPSDRSRCRGRVLFAAGVLACLQGRPREATGHLEESVAIARESGDPRSEAYALNYLGMALIQEGKPEGEAPIRAAMAWFREAEELYGLRLALLLQASLAMAHGRQEEAAAFAREGVEVARAFGQDRELGVALHVLGVVAFEEGRHDRVLELLRESLECFRRDPFDLFIARSLELAGSIEALRGNHPRALRLIGAADGIGAGLEANLFGIDRARLEPGLAAARESLGEAEVQRLRDEGRRLGPDRVVIDGDRYRINPDLKVRFDVARFDACAEAARLVVRTDDLREEGHRLLMTSLARSGQVDEALRHYENLEVFLRQELGSEPEPETRRLAEQLRSDVSSAG